MPNRCARAAKNVETALAAVKAIENGGDISGYQSLAEALKDKRDALAAAKSAYKELTGEDYGQKKPTPDPSKAEEEAAKTALDAESRLAEARIELERKRITDKIKLLEYDKQVTFAAIDEQIKAAKSEAERIALENLKNVVSQTAQVEIDIETNSRNADKQADLNEMLSIYSNYSQERMKIEQQFNEDIGKLRPAATEATTAEEKARYTSAAEEAERQMRNALASLDVNALKEYEDAQVLLQGAQREYNAALREQAEIEAAIKDGSLPADSEKLAQAKERVADAANKQAKAEKNVVSADRSSLRSSRTRLLPNLSKFWPMRTPILTTLSTKPSVHRNMIMLATI